MVGDDEGILAARTGAIGELVLTLDHARAVAFARQVWQRKDSGGTVYFAGNGASNTIADHAALDYMSQTGVRTHTISNPSVLTAFANDFGYGQALRRFLQIKFQSADMLVVISSSGNSENVVRAADYVRSVGGSVVAFTGFEPGNRLARLVEAEQHFFVDSRIYNVVESVHNAWLAAICDLLASWMGDGVGVHGIELD